jgi:tungstate transport system substrate-binding protein
MNEHIGLGISLRLNRTNTILVAVLLIAIIGATYIAPPKAETRRLVVSTTTSLYDTGVIDMLEDSFEESHRIDLRFISAGTGLAIAHAERGDADMILVHAPGKELEFMEEGYGVNRKIIAYNYFTIAGPLDDPAGIRGMDASEAMETLVEMGRKDEAVWVSRGDDSGTHSKEKALWGQIGFESSEASEEPWYVEAGTGMGKTLQIAEERQGYTLADMGTYLKYREGGLVSLEMMVVSVPSLLNVYSAIAVNPDTVPGSEFEGAMEFIEFLVSEEAQTLIGEYGRVDYGMNLFDPAVEVLETDADPETAGWIVGMAFFEGYECPPRFRVGETDLYG